MLNQAPSNGGPQKALALPGFESVPRRFDARLETFVARISVGESYVTRHDEMISTVLGSCICACIRDPILGIGGMNHFMLPGGAASASRQASIVEQRFGVAAMESLINSLLIHGGVKSRFEVKVFGGAELIGSGSGGVGASNAAFAQQFLQAEGLRLSAQDCGGPYPRRVLYRPLDGRVMVKRMPINEVQSDLAREKTFARNLTEKPPEGDVELFD